MKKLLLLVISSVHLLWSQITFGVPEREWYPSRIWTDDQYIYAFYIKTQVTSFSLAQKAKPFKILFRRIDKDTKEIRDRLYDYEGQYEVVDALNTGYKPLDNHVIYTIASKVFCYDFNTDEVWEIGTFADYTGPYVKLFMVDYEPENQSLRLYLPGKQGTVVDVNLEERTSEFETFGYEGVEIVRYNVRFGNHILTTCKTEKETVLWLIIDVASEEYNATVIKFPSFVKTYSTIDFFANAEADQFYFSMCYYERGFVQHEWRHVFKVDMETGESESILDMGKISYVGFTNIGKYTLVATKSGSVYTYYKVYDGEATVAFTNKEKLVNFYIKNDEYYASGYIENHKYKLYKIDKTSLSIEFIKEYKYKSEAFPTPLDYIIGPSHSTLFQYNDSWKDVTHLFTESPY